MRSTGFAKSAAAVILLLLAIPAYAQATVNTYASSATDPNTSKPLSTVVYTPTCNQVPGGAEVTPIANPTDGYWLEASGKTECRVNVQQQISALPVGSGYKAALKIGSGVFGPFSNAFAVAAQTSHPCDGTDPTSGSVVAGTRTLTWCYPDGADGGSSITGWAIYVDGVRTLVTNVSVGSSANASGRRAYSASITVATGTRTIREAPVNAIGEGNQSPVYTLTVQAPATVPTGTPGTRGVQ